MSIESEIFLHFVPDYEKLVKFGFKNSKGNTYFYKGQLSNADFYAELELSKNGELTGKVYDNESGEEFLPLRIESQEGAFIGNVKNSYIELLKDIREKCFSETVFVSAQGNRIADLIYKEFGDKPVFLWKDDPTSGVFKHLDNNKWYGIVMYIGRNKLDKKSDDMVEVMNLKLDTDIIPELVKREGFYPAYHMNKKSWITLTLDDTLSDKEIMKHIGISYSLTEKKKK